MRVVRSLLIVLLLIVAVVLAAPTNKRSTNTSSTDNNQRQQSNNVIQQVIKALAGRDDMKRVIEYLEKTEDDLIEKLPTVGSDGKANHYTFMAPTSSAFSRAIPQDIANPFSYDKQLRHNVLLRHFVRRSLAKEDLEAATLTEITMADNTLFKVEHNGDEHLINERIVIKTTESESSESVKIYVVDGVFTSGDEVSQAISRNPNPPINPFIRLPPPTASLAAAADQVQDQAKASEGAVVPSSSSSETAAAVADDVNVEADADVLIIADEVLTSAKKVVESQTIVKADSGKSYKIVSHKVEKIQGTSKHRLIVEIETELTAASSSKRSRATELAEAKISSTDKKNEIKSAKEVTSSSLNVIQQVIQVLREHSNMQETVSYLEKSEEDLVTQLPLVDSDGKVNHYTFFAPRTSDFILAVPQDIGNPFYYDNKLRNNVLLRHFVRRHLTKEHLEAANLTSLTMADNTTLTVTHDKDGKHLIDDNTVQTDKTLGRSSDDVVYIYVVEGVFTAPGEVDDAISRDPNPTNPFVNVDEEGLASSTDESTTDFSLINQETTPVSITTINVDEPTKIIIPEKPFIVGGYSTADVNNERVKEMASFAATTVSQALNSAKPLTVLRIVSAETQVVAGANYKMEIELKDDDTPDPIKCLVVVFDQSWTNTRRVSQCSCCGDSWTSADNKPTISIIPVALPTVELDQQEAESFSASVQPLSVVEDYKTIDVEDEQVKKMALLAAKLVLEENKEGAPVDVKVLSALTQQLRGTLKYKMSIDIKSDVDSVELTCDVIVDDDDIVTVQDDGTTTITNQQNLYKSDCKRKSSNLPAMFSIGGGYSDTDVNDETVKEMATFAATTAVSQALNSAQPLAVVRIVSAKSQVVSGVNYDLEMELKASDESDVIKCQVVVYDQSWTNTRRVTKCSCCGDSWTSADEKPFISAVLLPSTLQLEDEKKPEATKTEKLTIVGGYSDIEVDDETVNKMAAYAAKELLEMREEGELKSVTVLSAGIQKLPTTFKYKMSVEIESSSTTALACDVIVDDQFISVPDDEGQVTTTNTQVLYDSACKPLVKAKSSRSEVEGDDADVISSSIKAPTVTVESLTIVGGYSSIETGDEEVQKMASFAATSVLETRKEGAPKSFKVNAASLQKLPGTWKYKMSLDIVGESDDELTCNVVVDDQHILNVNEQGEGSVTKNQILYESDCKAKKNKHILPSITALPVLGGYTMIDANEDAVKEIASFVATALTQTLNSAEPLTVAKVVSASRQVVAGFNYDLELELKDGKNNNTFQCKVIVFDQSWTKTREMSECSCCGPSSANSKTSSIAIAPAVPKTTLSLPPLPL